METSNERNSSPSANVCVHECGRAESRRNYCFLLLLILVVVVQNISRGMCTHRETQRYGTATSYI